MEELNHCKSLEVLASDGYDTLVVNDLGESLSLTQVAEDGRVHNIVISHEQAEGLLRIAARVIG